MSMATKYHTMPRDIRIDFDSVLRQWDGFGFTYVETSQTIDYTADPQEYGGFSLLSTADQDRVIELVYGANGLKPGLAKVFLDPFHQSEDRLNATDPLTIDQRNYDHEKSTKWVREFVRRGLEETRRQGRDLSIITTLFGPPPFMTTQRIMRGRDLDDSYRDELVKYVAAWAQHLREVEGFPVNYVSLHNEGEDLTRWPADGSHGNIGSGHDYNLLLPPDQVCDLIKRTRTVLDANGMKDVGVAPGETTSWIRFWLYGYADEIADDSDAMNALGIITSHGFSRPIPGAEYFDSRPTGVDLLRSRRPELPAWVTSTSWSQMDPQFVFEIFNHIYMTKVNGIIPWAGIQVPSRWVGGDPNPGAAIHVSEDGTFRVLKGYHYYKQVCPVGQPGMGVARIRSNDTALAVIAFSSNGTANPDAFIVISLAEEARTARVSINGTRHVVFNAHRTSELGDRNEGIGEFRMNDNTITYEVPPLSVTTFVGSQSVGGRP